MIKQKLLCSKLGISTQTLTVYLCRAEFSHIKRKKEGKTIYYEGFCQADIDKLRELTSNRYRIYNKKSKIDKLDLLKGQYQALLKQNESLQKENAELRETGIVSSNKFKRFFDEHWTR